MAYHSKEVYERKNEWAARRMAENAETETLTKEQHEALAELCRLRHHLHTHWDDAFNAESSEYNEIAEQFCESYVDASDDACWHRIKKLFGKSPFKPVDWPTTEDVYFDCEEEYGADYTDHISEYYADYHEQACEMLSQINDEIESFLAKIDEEHGTNYCPSGATRI